MADNRRVSATVKHVEVATPLSELLVVEGDCPEGVAVVVRERKIHIWLDEGFDQNSTLRLEVRSPETSAAGPVTFDDLFAAVKELIEKQA